jgi:hypothetical protein
MAGILPKFVTLPPRLAQVLPSEPTQAAAVGLPLTDSPPFLSASPIFIEYAISFSFTCALKAPVAFANKKEDPGGLKTNLIIICLMTHAAFQHRVVLLTIILSKSLYFVNYKIAPTNQMGIASCLMSIYNNYDHFR